MSGHSKWSTIKHKKAITDAKRGASFTKIARLIEVAAKGGPDPEMNPRLKLAIQKGRAINMPANNIEKAIKKGAGLDTDKSQIEEITYEGVGPGNVAFMVETITDNKNRTVSELRNIFNKAGGSLGNSGSVAWQFASRGVITVPKRGEDLELTLIDAGAIDVIDLGDAFEVHTEPRDLNLVKQNLTVTKVDIAEDKLALIPNSVTVVADSAIAKKVAQLIETLEDNDDVAQVYTNFEVDEKIADSLS